MTNVELLKTEISKSGLPISVLARKMGLSREGLYLKLNGETEFKVSEIVKLSAALHLSHHKRDEIFFANEVN